MNRELRRLTQKDEKRQRKERVKRQPRQKKERVGIRQFLREVRQELSRVAWPSRRELFTFTVVVLITTTTLTLIVFGFDVIFKILVLDLIRELG